MSFRTALEITGVGRLLESMSGCLHAGGPSFPFRLQPEPFYSVALGTPCRSAVPAGLQQAKPEAFAHGFIDLGAVAASSGGRAITASIFTNGAFHCLLKTPVVFLKTIAGDQAWAGAASLALAAA
jgi:hypothetical protein